MARAQLISQGLPRDAPMVDDWEELQARPRVAGGDLESGPKRW